MEPPQNPGRFRRRRYLCGGEGEKCGCPRLDAERIEERVWDEVRALLTEPGRLAAMAEEYVSQSGDWAAARDDLPAVEATIAKLERALRETVVDYAREGVPAAVVKAATDALAGELAQLRRHRAELVRWRSAEAAADRRLKRLWSLATTAHERLHGMTDEERAALLSMLAVRVTLTGARECPRCEGRGKLNGRRGGYRCDRCRGLRKLVDVRIEGEVVDGLGDALAADGGQGHLLPMPSAVS